MRTENESYLFINLGKEDTKSESNIAWVSMCCPMGAGAIARSIMNSQKTGQAIIRRCAVQTVLTLDEFNDSL